MIIALSVMVLFFTVMYFGGKENEKEREEKRKEREARAELMEINAKAQEILTELEKPFQIPPQLIDKNPPQYIYSDLKGLYYRSKRAKSEADDLSVGDKLYCEPDPHNKYDKNAIKIKTGTGVLLGYVDAAIADEFKEYLEWARYAIVDQISYDDEIPTIRLKITFLWTDLSKI